MKSKQRVYKCTALEKNQQIEATSFDVGNVGGWQDLTVLNLNWVIQKDTKPCEIFFYSVHFQ